MRHLLTCIHVLAVAILLSACGQAEFGSNGGSADSKSTSTSVDESQQDPADATGEIHTVGDLEENPALAELYSCGNKKEKKVVICHRPEGNPAKAHTLCIGAPALDAHLNQHGEGEDQDTLGACPAEAQVEQESNGHSGNCNKKK